MKCLASIMIATLACGCGRGGGSQKPAIIPTNSVAGSKAAILPVPKITTPSDYYAAFRKMPITPDFLPIEAQFVSRARSDYAEKHSNALSNFPPFGDETATNATKLTDSDYRAIAEGIDPFHTGERLSLVTAIKGREYEGVKVIIIEEEVPTPKASRVGFC
ncbi:MAG: hypothetical protein ABSG04_15790 [Verrucomicrobiota bacterium]